MGAGMPSASAVSRAAAGCEKLRTLIGSILENPVYAILAAILPHRTLTTRLSHLNNVV